jgi:hypothetical protein
MHTRLFIIPRLLSEGYHDYYWYPIKGRKHVKAFMATEWGQLWQKY